MMNLITCCGGHSMRVAVSLLLKLSLRYPSEDLITLKPFIYISVFTHDAARATPRYVLEALLLKLNLDI